jgi:UDP-3-O-[3-hydroxymyristoyl] glucosamine N-acyltransferase
VIAIGNPELRRKFYFKIRNNANVSFPNIVGEKASCYADISNNQGIVIYDHVFISGDAKIGDFTIIRGNSFYSHDCDIASFTILPAGNYVNKGIKIEL